MTRINEGGRGNHEALHIDPECFYGTLTPSLMIRMELFHLPRAVLLISLAFNFQVVLAANSNVTTEIGTLPICAQACIASSFSTCSCRMLDFDCACACTTFSPTASFCIQGACSPSYLKPAVEIMSLACPPALPSTSTSSSSRSHTTASATISGGAFRTASADPIPSPTVTTTAGPYGGGLSGNSSYPSGSSECLYQTASGVPGKPTCWIQAGINAAPGREFGTTVLLWSLVSCLIFAGGFL